MSLLSLVPEDRIFIASKEEILSYGEVLSKVEVIREQLIHLSGENIALVAKDQASLIVYFIAVQSISASVYLQSSDINKDSEALFYDSANISHRIEVENFKINSIVNNFSPIYNRTDILDGGQVILATSGTTGVPKLASYSLQSLTSTCQSNIGRGEEFTWGLCYDVNRFAGLQVLLQAISSGSRLIIEESNMMEVIIKTFIKNEVNCISATPSFWRKLLMTSNHENMPLKRITLGGEISSQQVLNALRARYQNAKIVHIYASTEAGVGFSVKDVLEGFPERYLEPKFSNKFQLKEKNGNLWIRTPVSNSKFVRGKVEIDNQGFINTGDLVEIKDGRVYFLGRDSGSINVGGNKVMPEKVEAMIEQCPLIAMAKVYAKKNPVLGYLVVADVVLNKEFTNISQKELKEEVLKSCKGKLAPYEIPVMIKSVEKLKMNATGKSSRN